MGAGACGAVWWSWSSSWTSAAAGPAAGLELVAAALETAVVAAAAAASTTLHPNDANAVEQASDSSAHPSSPPLPSCPNPSSLSCHHWSHRQLQVQSTSTTLSLSSVLSRS